jgi:hypothetical protein
LSIPRTFLASRPEILGNGSGQAIACPCCMDAKAKALQARTHRFLVNVITFTRTIPSSKVADENRPATAGVGG